jgi:hypothetical protein
MRNTGKRPGRAAVGRHALSGLAQEFHAKLFALAEAQDREVHDFASPCPADRFFKIGDIARPLSVHSDDQLV